LLIDDYDTVYGYIYVEHSPTPRWHLVRSIRWAISAVLCIIVSGKSENGWSGNDKKVNTNRSACVYRFCYTETKMFVKLSYLTNT